MTEPSILRLFIQILLLFPPAQGTQSAVAQVVPAISGTRLSVDVNGNLYVINAEANILRLYSPAFVPRREVGGQGWGDNQFDHPSGVWARNGIDVFVADYGNHRIQRFDRSLNFVASFSTRDNDNPDQRFGYPTDVAVSPLGDLFLCDGENSRILKVDRFSQVERTFGGFDAGKGRLENPGAVQVGPRDQIFIVDGARIVVFDYFGNYTGMVGEGLWGAPLCLYADESVVAVVDSARLYCFDADRRPVLATTLAAIGVPPGWDVRSVTLLNGRVYLLGTSGLVIVTDPRTTGGSGLDKEPKNR